MRLRLLFMFLLAALCMLAQQSFEGTVAYIVNNNPDIIAKFIEAEAQVLEAGSENTLANPSVEFARVWGNHGIGNKLQLDVSQDFEWPGIYGTRSKAVKAAAQAVVLEDEVARNELAMQVRQLLIELVYVRSKIAVVRDLQANFRSLVEVVDKGVKGGELTLLDQRKMLIEQFEIDNDMAALLSREQQIISELQGMTSKPLDLDEITAYPVQPTLSLDEYLRAVATYPEITAAAYRSSSEALNAKAASQSRLPGFSVGYQHQAEMGDRFNGFTVGMTLPVYSKRKARGAAMGRSMAYDMAKAGMIEREMARVNGVYADMMIQRDRIEAYRQALGDNQYLSLLLKACNGGQISVIEYLSEVHYYHQTMLTYLESQYNFNLALTQLNRSPVPHNIYN